MNQLQRFLHQLCQDTGRVEQKFVASMVSGILTSHSVNLTNIAASLQENISLHATHKRLSRNLDNPVLHTQISEKLLQQGAAKVSEDTRLIVHTYALNKKYARKIEYLSPNDDAGFKVCEVLASDTGAERYTPLIAHVWSDRVPGFISDEDEVRKTIQAVQNATRNKGLFYLEEKVGSMSSMVPGLISDYEGFEFISLLYDDEMEVICRDGRELLKNVVGATETRYGKIMFKLIPGEVLQGTETDMDIFFHVGAQPIRFPHSLRELNLIALKYKNVSQGENASPLITSRTNLRSRKALMGLVESFLSIQDVITTHVALRDTFKPENFRVLSYGRLQLLMTLMLAALRFEAAGHGIAPHQTAPHQIAVKPHHGEMDRTYLMPAAAQEK